MKLRKQLASLAVVGMMSVVAASSAFAAGVGYVNFDTLVQSHKDFPTLKTDQEKQELGRQLAQNLSKLENSLIVPIEKDVVNKVEQVRKDKNLDCIVAQGAIIAGADKATDETQEVAKLLK